ncbi:hypothetical protein ASC64_07165 [Nocardioides sp. Root122]|nr:hypothetical protein ASC64_07165 [Nocardioides sp. Root122]
MGVVDDSEYGSVSADLGEQVQCGEVDQASVASTFGFFTEGGAQRARLGGWDVVEALEHRTQQPVQRSEGQRSFGLDTARAEDGHTRALIRVPGGRDRVVEQGGFPDARLAAEDQRGSVAGCGTFDERAQC